MPASRNSTDRVATGQCGIREAACWAHLRRDFHDVWKSTGSPIAREALDRIGALYDIEREINGQPADERLTVRQRESLPRAQAFRCWCDEQLVRISGKSDLAKAMRYALNRWASFTLFLEDGRVAIDNNPAERALRPIALGRKNFLFAGSGCRRRDRGRCDDAHRDGKAVRPEPAGLPC